MTDWSKLKVVELRSELKERGLAQTGLKSDLVARLTEADAEAPIEEEEEEEEAEEADNEPVATAPTPDEPKDEPEDEPEAEPEAALDGPPEDVAPPAGPIEEEAAPLEPVVEEVQPEQVQLEEVQPEATTQVVPDDAPSTLATDQDTIIPKTTDSVPADEPMADADAEMKSPSPKQASQTPQAPEDMPDAEIRESQKRKRRSLTPPPTEEAIAKKRARVTHDDEINGTAAAPPVRDPEDAAAAASLPPPPPPPPPQAEPPSDEMHVDEDPRDGSPPEFREQQDTDDDFERHGVPPVHPATTALYIKNFMRPLRPDVVQAHLADLATPPADRIDDAVIVDFFLDQVRTHAFVVFKSTAAATRVRNALHDVIWPNETTRKPLWVDFVPPAKVRDWIATEESRGPRSAARWEVVYEDGAGGEVEAHLESGAASFSRTSNRPPPGPFVSAADAIPPSGPRGLRDLRDRDLRDRDRDRDRDIDAPPRGPRADRAGPGEGGGPRRGGGGPNLLLPRGDSRTTQAYPVIHFRLVASDLAQRRIHNMRAHYTKDRDRDVGRDINRYSFESGDVFVDRGKEVFEGIRPPHRERAMERERRGFGPNGGGGGGPRRRRGGGFPRGGGGGFRPRSDRYLPGSGSGSGRDDRGSLRFDDDREFAPRRRGDWDRDRRY